MIDRRDIASTQCKARQRGWPFFFIPAHPLSTDANSPRFRPDMTLMELICSFRQSFFQITKPITRYAHQQPSHSGDRRTGFCISGSSADSGSGTGIDHDRSTGIGDSSVWNPAFRFGDLRLRHCANSSANSGSGVIANNSRSLAEQKPGCQLHPAFSGCRV